ncbi:glycosyltransferase family 4 protein [Halopenitus persicus]|uniref:Glycosyltransferase Family 4 n=1 Tax=Halopenitus persicus TaxID=1048396 RepID=A0A1H3J1B6_9EURY|nr:glycosyltransferase family 4 protein [Halopenitus persicus]SDY32964.1 Glycosyltransferase Family 4 [Halopenitus persicus]
MARFVYEMAAETGYDPCLVCNVLDPEVDVRTTDLLTLDINRKIEHTTVDGMELKGIPRILPEIEFTQYVLNRRFWQTALADGDAYFGVGGSNHCCFPLVQGGHSFGSWTATQFWEDRIDRLESASFPRRARDHLSKTIMEWIEGRTYRSADPVFVLSEHTADAVAQRHDIERDEIRVVPYPIDTDLFSPAGIEKPDCDRPTILFVGRFNDSRKNTSLLLQAIDTLREDIPDIRLLLIGDEPDPKLQQQIDALDLNDHVESIDYVDNEKLPAYYRGADVFAIPSQQEGLAIVGLEAMACGTPVVSTQCGGPEEYVIDGETGYLVSADDIDAFADRLTTVLHEDGSRESMANRAREVVVETYSREQVGRVFRTELENLAK